MRTRASTLARFRMTGLAALALAAALVLSPSVDAAKVTAKVTGWLYLVNPVWEEARDPKRHRYSFREPVPTVPAQYRKLFPNISKELCIAAIGKEKQKAGSAILIRVGGGRTWPVTVVAPPGTKLQFQNTDPFPHRLYGVGINTFQPGDTAKGAHRDWSVPGKGTFEIRDELAPSVRMYVIGEERVVKSVYPSLKGKFAMNLEEGEYTLQAFFAGKKVGTPYPLSVGARDMDISRKPLVVAKAPKKSKKKKGK